MRVVAGGVVAAVLACLPVDPNPRPAALARSPDDGLSVMALLCPGDVVRDVTFAVYPESDSNTVTGARVVLARLTATDNVAVSEPRVTVFGMSDAPAGFELHDKATGVIPRTGLVAATVRLDDGFRIYALAAPGELREDLVVDGAGTQVTPESFKDASGDDCPK